MESTLSNVWILLYILSNIIPVLGYPCKTCSTSTGSIDSNFNSMAPIGDALTDEEINNVVLFDGVCNFCNKWVDIMMHLDTKKRFRFCALQSHVGRNLAKKIGRNPDELSSVVLIKSIEDGDVHLKSDAVLKVIEQLGLFWFLFSNISSLLPLYLRNTVYDMVASNRYSILGKRPTCRRGGLKDSDRFL